MNKALKLLIKITQKYYYIWLEGSLLPLQDDYLMPSLFRFLVPLPSQPLMMPPLLYWENYSKADIANTSVKPYPSVFMLSLSSSLPQRSPTMMRWILSPPPFSLLQRFLPIFWILPEVCYLSIIFLNAISSFAFHSPFICFITPFSIILEPTQIRASVPIKFTNIVFVEVSVFKLVNSMGFSVVLLSWLGSQQYHTWLTTFFLKEFIVCF